MMELIRLLLLLWPAERRAEAHRPSNYPILAPKRLLVVLLASSNNTLIRILACLQILPPDHARIEVAGRVIGCICSEFCRLVWLQATPCCWCRRAILKMVMASSHTMLLVQESDIENGASRMNVGVVFDSLMVAWKACGRQKNCVLEDKVAVFHWIS
jgi:hypothetical protein